MSGSRSTASREAATMPKSTIPTVTMKTVTGRLIDPSTSRMGPPAGCSASPSALREGSLQRHGLDLGPRLEPTLADGDHPVAGREPGQDLRGLAFSRPDLDGDSHDRIAARDEDVVLPVLREHSAPGEQEGVREAAGLEPDAREGAGTQHFRGVRDLE